MVGQSWVMEVSGCSTCRQQVGQAAISPGTAMVLAGGGILLGVGLPVLIAWWLGASPVVIAAVGATSVGIVAMLWSSQ